MLYTQRTVLIPFADEHFQAIFNNDNILLGKLLRIKTPTSWSEFEAAREAIHALYGIYKSLEGNNDWGSYFILSKEKNELAGTCGFKGKPGHNSQVEIGYEINESFRNEGLATEVTRGLIDFAFSKGVKEVIAHTLPEKNPSTRVLEKCGFIFADEIMDSEDGIIWQWKIKNG